MIALIGAAAIVRLDVQSRVIVYALSEQLGTFFGPVFHRLDG